MPLKALFNGKIVYSWDVGKWSENAKDSATFVCPYCFGEMIFVDAKLKVKHFRHLSRCPYEVEPETQDHMQMKKVVFDWLSRFGKADVEVAIGNNIADVVCGDLVVEVQRSNLSAKELLERTRNYSSCGYYAMWLLHPERMDWRKWFIVLSRAWRFLIYFNHSHLYFLDPRTRNLGKYRLRKKYGGIWLEGSRYAVVDKVWKPVQEYSVFKYKVPINGEELLGARPVLFVGSESVPVSHDFGHNTEVIGDGRTPTPTTNR